MEQLQITGGFLKDTNGKYIADLTTNTILRDLAPEIVQAVNSHDELVECKRLLNKHHWVEHKAMGEDGVMTWCICCDESPPHHAPDCEIAKALEMAKEK